MTELDEITLGKDLAYLKKELAFQLNNGEALGGTICSSIVSKIEIMEAKHEAKVKEAYKTQMCLGYEIKVCTNGDGVILLGPNAGMYKHKGNYGHGMDAIKAAKKAALCYFMMTNKDLQQLIARRVLYKKGAHQEFSLLKGKIEKAGFEVPVEITGSDGLNNSILFDGERF